MTTPAKVDAALGYAEAGALVLPLHTPTETGCSCRRRACPSVGKHPRTLNGKDDATSDPETITRWWSMWPDANVGVRPHSGVVVLDVDPRHGGGRHLVELQREHRGTLSATQTVRTGSGGLHIWLGHHGPVRGRLAPGIDVKTHAGYLVMPPSTHVSGGRYTWLNERSGIRPAPRWLGGLLAPATVPLPIEGCRQATPARVGALLRVVREAKHGERNSRLFWACCRAVECGLDPAPLVAAAVETGLTDREALNTARSAVRSVRRAA